MTEERKRELTNLLFQKKKDEMVQQVMKDKVQTWEKKHMLDDITDKRIQVERKKSIKLIKSYEETAMVVMVLDINDCIDCYPTYQVYELYVELCKQCSIAPMKKEYFSVFVKRFFDYLVVDKKKDMVKYRLFVKKSHYTEG